jgi:hypothetical protein
MSLYLSEILSFLPHLGYLKFELEILYRYEIKLKEHV